jgi:alpha-N-acetylglucosamine transferase
MLTEPIKKQRVIVSYTTQHLQYKDKIRFYYALKGRDGKTGIIKRLEIEQLGKTVLLVQTEYTPEVEDFLKYWKCNYSTKKVIMADEN